MPICRKVLTLLYIIQVAVYPGDSIIREASSLPILNCYGAQRVHPKQVWFFIISYVFKMEATVIDRPLQNFGEYCVMEDRDCSPSFGFLSTGFSSVREHSVFSSLFTGCLRQLALRFSSLLVRAQSCSHFVFYIEKQYVPYAQ